MAHDSRNPPSEERPFKSGPEDASQSELPLSDEAFRLTDSQETYRHALRPKRRRWLFWGISLAFLAFVLWFVPPVWMLIGNSVTVTRWTKKEGQHEARVGPSEKLWMPLEKISKHALHAVISSEDGKFRQHRGLDWESIHAAYKLNQRRGTYARGGSTITQQVVKMAFLSREKTMIRKAREAVGALLLETLLTKDEILGWYLNLAEFGDGVYGIHQGARHYFQTKPELLTIAQSIHLALVLPSPNRWSKGLRTRKLSAFGHKRFTAILNNMKLSGYVSHTQWLATVRTGDFGRPLAGYTSLLAAEREGKLCQDQTNCLESVTSPTETDGARSDAPAEAPANPPTPSERVDETIDALFELPKVAPETLGNGPAALPQSSEPSTKVDSREAAPVDQPDSSNLEEGADEF